MRRTALVTLLAVTLLALPGMTVEAAPADKGPAGDGSRVILDWDQFVRISGWTGVGDSGAAKITMTWAEAEELLGVKLKGVKGARVVLSQAEYKTLVLWSLTRKHKPEDDAPKPPTSFVITSADYVGSATKDGLSLTMTMKVDILQKEGWKWIMLLPANVALEEVTLPDGCYLDSSRGTYRVLTQKSGKLEFKVKFAVAVRESQGIFSGGFNRTPSGASTLTITLKEKDSTLTILGAQTTTTKGDTVHAALPSAGAVTVSWRRSIQEVEAVAKLYSESQTLISVAEGVIIGRQNVRFSILHNKVDTVSMKVPKGVSVLSVIGRDLRDWRTEKDTLTLDLKYPRQGNWTCSVVTETPLAEGGAIDLPILKPTGVIREKGTLVVVAQPNVEISTDTLKGATEVDVRQIPPSLIGMTHQPILLAYRYATDVAAVRLAIQRHPDVDVLLAAVDTASAIVLQTDDGIRVTNILMNVRNSRQQNLKLKMPKGAKIWSLFVDGKRQTPGQDAQGHLLIPLVRSGSGTGHTAFPVEITYQQKVDPLNKKKKDKLRINFPKFDVPVSHFMCSVYMPPEFDTPRDPDDYTGTLKRVKQFTPLSSSGRDPMISAVENAENLRKMQDQQAQRVAGSQGLSNISVKLPLHGKPFMLEKILVIDQDLWTEYQYEYDD